MTEIIPFTYDFFYSLAAVIVMGDGIIIIIIGFLY